jgi:class 3 adenylate cyclase
VKWLGDGVMFQYPDPSDAVRASLDMVDAGKAAGLPPAHVGIHAGPVLFQEGDYFGRTVNLASRISDVARPSEVLVSRDVVEAVGEADDLAFEAIGPVRMKGVERDVELLRASRTG